jgi:hypothetical protein
VTVGGAGRRKVGAMKLIQVAAECASGTCPTVWATEEGDLVVQGYEIIDMPIDGGLPRGEAAVRVPRNLVLRAARELMSDR